MQRKLSSRLPEDSGLHEHRARHFSRIWPSKNRYWTWEPLPPCSPRGGKTAFTVSVDYIPETTTGISAADRAATVRALVREGSSPDDFARPGHVFPLRAHPNGVLSRPGHTEAAVDLARLAGLAHSGVICEVANDDGTMARLPDLEAFAEQHGLHLITIEDLIAYRSPSVAVKAA